jgi:hypothetical protein
MRRNLLQKGFSILMGWFIIFVSYVVIARARPDEVMILGVLLLGLSLMGLGFIEKGKTSSTHWAKTLLQIGVVVTIIWVMFLLQMGLSTLNVPIGAPTHTPLIVILFLGVLVLGLILLALGVVLNRRTEKTKLEDDY